MTDGTDRTSLESDISLTARTFIDGRRAHRALSLPVERATTFQADDAAMHRELWTSQSPEFYQRFGHPTSEFVAERIAHLEKADAALVFSSGMGAIATTLFAMVPPGSHIVSHHRIFAQTEGFMRGPLGQMGVQVTFVDARTPESVTAALTENTRVVYLETPSNPWLDVQDIRAIARGATARGAIVIVDSTFASPILQKPLESGATLVLHSATKFLGGHSDVMAGAVAGPREALSRIRKWQVLLGTVLAPDAAWLLFRGMRTLGLRVPRQAESATRIARALAAHPSVRQVYYPGLSTPLPAGQMLAGGGVVSFELADSSAARTFVDRLRAIPIATSLGGTETVIELPLELDFDNVSVPAGLVRLSIGLEPPDELLSDLVQALTGIAG